MQPSIELRHLRYFSALADEMHFGRAARRLGIAQPALSQQIAKLELLLGARLVERTSRRVGLTAAGSALAEEARRLAQVVESATTRVQSVARGERGTFRLGVSASGAFGLLPDIIREFRRSHRDVKLELFEAAFDQPFGLIESGALDAAITRGPSTHPRVTMELIQRERLCMVLPADHALARRRTLQLGALRDEAFILFPRNRAPGFHDVITGMCGAAGFVPDIIQEVTEWQLLASLVAAGLGVTLAPESVRRMPREGVVYRTLNTGPVAELLVAHLAVRASSVTEAFLSVTRRVAHQQAGSRRGSQT